MKLLDPEGRPQVFLYDDFLGHTSLTERLARNEEHRLVDFLDLVANSDDRLFVLTTREHLFGQAQQTYVRLGEPVVDAHRFVLPMEGYSELERARILYTHLYFAEDLTGEAKQSVVADEAYRRVLAHSNYNPRLLAGAIDAARKSANDATFCGALIAALDDPLSIWRQSYSEELSDQGRAVLMTLASFAERVELSDLGRAFEATCLRQGLSTLNFALDNALKAVQGTFVRIDVDPGADLRFVAPVNPSVSDFLQQLLSENTPEARVALESATFFEQLQGLWAALSIIADGQPTAPADELADGFAAALVRTLDAPTASWDRVIYGRRDGTLHYERQRVDKTARALDVLAFAHSTPTYERVLGPLAGQAVDAAVTSWNDKRSSQFSALRLAAVLDERDELSGQIKQRLADRILAVQYQPADFRALLMLRERHPELVDSDAMAAAKRAAYAWIEDELTNQLGEMADPSEVSELMDLAETMELDVDPKRFQAAAREVQERLDEEGDAATDVDATSAPAAPEAEEAADGDAVRTLLARLAEL